MHSTSLLRLYSAFLLIIFCAACGSIEVQSAQTGDASESPAAIDSGVFVFATDYESSGQLYFASVTDGETNLYNSGVTLLGSSAIVRSFNDMIYVLHDGFSTGSNNNLQIIDPNDDYKTVLQQSTGDGTNPHDVLVNGESAFISLYNPGENGDVIEMNTTTGEITNRYSFSTYLKQDGDLNANADQMQLSGTTLYVLLGDLASNTFAANSNGLIGMIDTVNHNVIGTIKLQGRNPFGFTLSADGKRLVVANMATYNSSLQNYDTSTAYGGIEIVNLNTKSTIGFLNDEDLGGYVERVRANDSEFFIVVSQFDPVTFEFSSKIITLPQDSTKLSATEVFDDAGSDIREIAVDGDYLWISRRVINSNTGLSQPKLELIEISSNSQIGETLTPVAPGMSMGVK